MSVMIDTSLGEVVVDLFCEEAPLAAKNFLKLCKMKYYNGCLFYNVQQNFMIQTGDPTATGKGGTSVYGLMYGEQARFFEDEISATSRKHDEAGLLSMANMGVPNSNGSQFFFSMRGDDMQHLDGKHTVFAKVMEGMETLEQINSQFCDDNGRPYRDIRILHTYVLDDPFDDPPQLVVPDESPSRDRPEEERVALRLGALDKVSLEADEKTELEREKQLREKTARSNAVVLEMIGDLPDADMKPPENVLFVCKLNPVTTDDDLEIIFTRFGTCRAEICRDHVTGDSLNYAFVEFEAIESCEEAFKKMNNVLIDDRRIRVDFSQSVAKEWSKYKGRAQGGQKLASGKGGKPGQHQPQTTKHADSNSKASDGGQPRRSKWGNAPSGGAFQRAVPVPAPASGSGEKRRRDDDEAARNGGGRRNGGQPDAATSRWSGVGGEGSRRREDSGQHHRRGDDRRHAGGEGGRNGGDETRHSRGGGGRGGGDQDAERRGEKDGGRRRDHEDRGNRSRGTRGRSADDLRSSDGRRREDDWDRGGRGEGGGRSESGGDDGRHRHHPSDRRDGDADADAGRHASWRRREEREGSDRRRDRDGQRSRRKERSRTRSRERTPRARSGSRDKGRRR